MASEDHLHIIRDNMDWISVTEISDSTWKELERMLDIKWDDIFSKISEKSAGPGPSLSEKKCFEQAEDRIKKIVLNWKPHESSAVATIGDVKDLLRELELQPAVERLESMCGKCIAFCARVRARLSVGMPLQA